MQLSTLKQIEANRRNALKSTGPATEDGKERTRLNALRHGLTAETVVLPLENADDYQAFEESVAAGYEAETAVERELVLRLASVLWRLRRATGIETSLFETAAPKATDIDQTQLQLTLVGGRDYPEDNHSPTPTSPPLNLALPTAEASQAREGVKRSFLELAALPTFPLDRLSRYEHTLWRQAKQIVLTLEMLGRRGAKHSRLSFF